MNAPKKRMLGCAIAALVVGGLVALSCLITAVLVGFAAQKPETRELIAKFGKGAAGVKHLLQSYSAMRVVSMRWCSTA